MGVRDERKRRVKNDSKVFGLSNQKDGGPITEMGRAGGEVWGRRAEAQLEMPVGYAGGNVD